MIIISWDVGVIHLAYCILEYKSMDDESYSIEIKDWDEINLIENSRINISCCGKTKGEIDCGKKASYFLTGADGEHIGFCRTHLSQSNDYWSDKKTKSLFKNCHNHHTCTFDKKTGDKCGKKATFQYSLGTTKEYYCNVHYKSELSKKLKQFAPQPIKNLTVRKHDTIELQYMLIQQLDKHLPHFSAFGITEVVIENQPSLKNPKMKSIAGTLLNYFMIRGIKDKSNGLDINLVRFMCPNNKLMLNKDNTLTVFKKSNKSEKYKLTKQLGIQYTKQLLQDEPGQLEYLDLYTKKDDLCDAYLQGRYYLEFIRFKNKTNAPKPKEVKSKPTKSKSKSGSKTTRKNKSKPKRKSKHYDKVITLD
jgi:hypothetical protein